MPAIIFVSGRLSILGHVLWQWRGGLASQDSGAPFSIELLHALLIGSFTGGSGGLVGLDAGDVVGIVDVP